MAAAVTRAELEEMAAELVEILDSFPDCCSLFPIRTKDANRGLVTFDASLWHPEQRAFERERTGRDLVLKSRQIGFTTLELARDVWFARQHDGVQVLVVGHDPDLVEQTFLDAKRFAEALEALGLAPKPRYSTKRELVWPDTHSVLRVVEAGATEVAAKKKGRSGTIHRLHCTEVAFWGAADDTMTALQGALTADAEVVIESTANGVGGRFHGDVVRAQRGELEGYKLHFWPWYEHDEYRLEPGEDFDPAPRDEWEQKLREAGCDDAQIAWWRRKVSDLGGGEQGLERALQEFPITPGAAFRAQGGQYLSAAACDRIERGLRAPLEIREIEWQGRTLGELRIYELPKLGREYYVPADIADGGGCLSATGAIDRRTGDVCAVFDSPTIDSGDLGLVVAAVARMYNKALAAPERNTGQATIRAMRIEAKYSRIYEGDDHKLGWLTSPSSRPVMWDDLRRAVEKGEASTPDARMASELRGLIRDVNGKPVHGSGSTDDLWTMWAIGWQMRLRGAGAKGESARTGTGPESARVVGEVPRASRLG